MISESEYHSRRVKLLQNIDEGVVILSSAPIKNRSNDTDYRYRQNSDFYYLTGINEPNITLVLSKNSSEAKSYLFLESHNEEYALWNGDKLTVESIGDDYRIDEVLDIALFDSELSKILENHKYLYVDFSDKSEMLESVKSKIEALKNSRGVKQYITSFIDVVAIIRELRAIKSSAEIEIIKKAIAITADAHHALMKMSKCGKNEYHMQALFEYSCFTGGAKEQAYEPIVACGDSANTLHYIDNNRSLISGELVLIDAGCEYELYASDITRTIPVDGRFTDAQKELYSAILYAQLNIIDAIKPDITRAELQTLSEKLLSQVLIDLEVLDEPLEFILEQKLFKKYYPHGVGHWMGLDVHDPSPYYDENGLSVALKAGMVLTIEPALYFRVDDMSVPKRFRGIGIRIEDNILVTEDGYENLSSMIAKSVEEIEAMSYIYSSSH